MTKVIDHLNSAKSTLFSFEILPPTTGESIEKLFHNIAPLIEFGPKFIDVTYHREEKILKKTKDDLYEQRSVRKRPGTVSICAAIMHRFDVDTVPHIICGGFTKEETEYALIDLDFLGIQNVLALRGDCMKNETVFRPTHGGHHYASELVSQIRNMNNGEYLDEDLQNPSPTNFCIGVAGYPEKHYECANLQTDMSYLKQKVNEGAEYIVTQMFFDNEKYFNFVESCKKNGINVPIIPGLKPLTTKRQLSSLPSRFFIDFPEALSKEVLAAKDNKQARQVGIEWSIHQCKELIKNGAPCLHFYSMGKSTAISEVARELF